MSIVQFPEPEVIESQFPVSAEMEAALSVLDVIGKTGLALVPPEPTDEMVAAGMAVSGVGAEQVRAVYSAMLDASINEGKRG
jgi:hypothetical protein